MTSKLVLIATAGILLAGSANAGLVTYRAHGPINQIVDFSDTDEFSTTSETWADLPGSSLKLVIPAGPRQLVMVRFTAKAACEGPDQGYVCRARIMAGNAEMLPNSGNFFVIATNTVANVSAPLGAAMDRSLTLGPGTYTIKVQYETGSFNNDLLLGDWHLNVQTADYGTGP